MCQILHRHARYLVFKIFNYFREDTDNCGPVHGVAKTLTQAEQTQAQQTICIHQSNNYFHLLPLGLILTLCLQSGFMGFIWFP